MKNIEQRKLKTENLSPVIFLIFFVRAPLSERLKQAKLYSIKRCKKVQVRFQIRLYLHIRLQDSKSTYY